MKHASDSGALPANVEQQRTRVSVDQDAPRHTSTVEYAGAYFGSGVDNSFSMERFARDFKIDIKSLDEEEMVFDMIGIDPAIANAFRRILLSEVPTMAIEKVRRPLLRRRAQPAAAAEPSALAATTPVAATIATAADLTLTISTLALATAFTLALTASSLALDRSSS